MIQNLKKGLSFFFSRIDWGEVMIGFLMLLMGMVFNRHYGYRFEWNIFFYLWLWWFFLKASTTSLEAVLSGEVYKQITIDKNPRMNPADLRNLMVRSYWILSLAFIATSFLPLIQIFVNVGPSFFSLIILSVIYLSEYLFFLEPFQQRFAGMFEFSSALISAFFLPALCFSLAQNYLKPELIWITFPIFLQLIAWRIANFLEKQLKHQEIPAFSLAAHLSTRNSLYVLTALLIMGSLTLFLDWKITGIWNKITLLTFGLLGGWWVFRSVRVQNPNWERALTLIRLLPIITMASVITALWHF